MKETKQAIHYIQLTRKREKRIVFLKEHEFVTFRGGVCKVWLTFEFSYFISRLIALIDSESNEMSLKSNIFWYKDLLCCTVGE